jgi:hypothetical protein
MRCLQARRGIPQARGDVVSAVEPSDSWQPPPHRADHSDQADHDAADQWCACKDCDLLRRGNISECAVRLMARRFPLVRTDNDNDGELEDLTVYAETVGPPAVPVDQTKKLRLSNV